MTRSASALRTVDEAQSPAGAAGLDALDVSVRDNDAQATGRLRESLDDGLRAVEEPILRADARAGDPCHCELRDQLAELSSGDEVRRNARSVLRRDVLAKPLEGLRVVSDEDVAAGTEPGIDAWVQSICELQVERQGIAGHEAVEARAPLLAHAARLQPGGSRSDPLPFVDDDAPDVAFREMKGDGETGDPGADDRDVAGHRETVRPGGAGLSSRSLVRTASGSKNPAWYASTTAWTRSRRPSFWRMCVTCVLTVVSLM